MPKKRAAPTPNGKMCNPSEQDEEEFATVTRRLYEYHKKAGEDGLFFERTDPIKVTLQFLFAADSKEIIGRADVDNMAKFYLDALKGTFYEDDCQVCSLGSAKGASSQYGGGGFVSITIKGMATDKLDFDRMRLDQMIVYGRYNNQCMHFTFDYVPQLS